ILRGFNPPPGSPVSPVVVPDLELFDFNDALKDSLLPDRFIEKNIEEAMQYISICGALRKDFHELAKLY
ncbi:MAG: hypothetical protein ACO29C_07565, partial [Fluviibacter sp.]